MGSQQVISLYNKKLGLLNNMKDLTSQIQLTPDENAADTYVNLMARREALVKAMREIDAQISRQAGKKEVPSDPAERAEVARLRERITQTAREIVELDEKMAAIVPNILAALKKGIYKINTGKSVSRMYVGNAQLAAGMHFDSRQ